MKIANNSRYHTDDLQRIVDHILDKHCVHPIQLGWGLARYYNSPDEVTLVFAEHNNPGQMRWIDGKNTRSYVRRMTYAQSHRVMLLSPDLVIANRIEQLTQRTDADGYCEAPRELVEEMVENLLYRFDSHRRSVNNTRTAPNYKDPVYRLRYRYGKKPKSCAPALEADRLMVRKRMDAEVKYRARQACHAIDKIRAAVHTYNKKQRSGDAQNPHIDALNEIRDQLEAVEQVLELVREK